MLRPLLEDMKRAAIMALQLGSCEACRHVRFSIPGKCAEADCGIIRRPQNNRTARQQLPSIKESA